MKSKIINIQGKDQEIFYSNSDSEFDNQIFEIFHMHNYGLYPKQKDGIYLDIGANVGMASLYFQPYAKMIYALEPNPVLYECLVKNTSKYDNIKTFNFGMGYADEKAALFADKDDSPPQTLFENPRNPAQQKQIVSLKRLDTFMEKEGIEKVDIMKIDIEGAEFAVLPSSSFANVAHKISVIIGEAHYNDYGCFAEAIPEILKEYGYYTTFVKLPVHNFIRTFHYTEPGRERIYAVPMDTLFYAYRVKNEELKKEDSGVKIQKGI